MSDSSDQCNLDAALLRAEQKFFEQANEQSQLHKRELTTLQDQKAELEKKLVGKIQGLEGTIQLLRRQLAQAQEEIGTANDRLEHTLATQIPPITLVQLAQAQEELAHALNQLEALQQWQHLSRNSLKLQLKLLVKTLLLRLYNRVRWLIPLRGARRIKSLLGRLKQRLSAIRR